VRWPPRFRSRGSRHGPALPGKKAVVFSYFGDGATSRGVWHEGVNLATVQKLPVVFICNNTSTPYHKIKIGDNIKMCVAMTLEEGITDKFGYRFPGNFRPIQSLAKTCSSFLGGRISRLMDTVLLMT
jgi:hypothetical protein